MVDVVNVVSSGSLGIEFDLKVVTQKFGELVDYDPGKYPGAYFRFGESEPLITLYRTGKYIITGSSSEQEARRIRERFLSSPHKHGVLPEADDDWFSVQNYVCVGDLAESLNLNALAIGLDLESTEYEPEQFLGLIYRPPGADSVVLLDWHQEHNIPIDRVVLGKYLKLKWEEVDQEGKLDEPMPDSLQERWSGLEISRRINQSLSLNA
jgi:transcription initiation factor TFIID TATA-box-binding protein